MFFWGGALQVEIITERWEMINFLLLFHTFVTFGRIHLGDLEHFVHCDLAENAVNHVHSLKAFCYSIRTRPQCQLVRRLKWGNIHAGFCSQQWHLMCIWTCWPVVQVPQFSVCELQKENRISQGVLFHWLYTTYV